MTDFLPGTRSSGQKNFYGKALRLVLPIVVQNLLSATISSTDIVMLNYVDQASISAVSLAVNYTNILFMFFYGLGAGVTMLGSQYHGKGDLEAVHLVEGMALRLSILMAMLFTAAAVFIPGPMMLVFTSDPELISIGSVYLRVVCASYMFWSITEIYMSTLRSTGRVAICTGINIIAFICNILMNLVFIFGLLGMPRLGAAGVALGTTISRFLALICCVIVSARSRDVKIRPSYMFRHNPVLFGDFLRMALPALLNDIIWGVAFSLYSSIMGHLGSDAIAAYSFVNIVRHFGTVLCFAVGSATGILLGNLLGEGREKEAREGAKSLMVMTVASGLLGGLVILLLIPFILRFADLSPQAMHYLKYMMLINTYYVMGVAMNTTLITGVFRAGGDSRFGMICDAIDMWGYALPLGFTAAFVLRLPVLWVYFLLCTDEFVKWPWVFRHYFSGKWVKNITRDYESEGQVP